MTAILEADRVVTRLRSAFNHGTDRAGLLKDVLDVISNMNKSATRVSADVSSSTNARIMFRVDVKDHAEIEFIKDNVGRIADVTRVYRSKPGLKA